ncbi:hypothetical protein AWB74_08393 [Caballeronia arvi]|uniref:Uncharacterized protein n=1 Tax=Caballeronia arvi TaxID=1777135 RepID=A0A158L492_9BURK|nr:hypothetical protein AWB74_08393 [Caballeronia arvi]
MHRTYQYHGFSIEVCVETNFDQRRTVDLDTHVGYVATVTILRPGVHVAVFSPLRFGDTLGHPFSSEADGLHRRPRSRSATG